MGKFAWRNALAVTALLAGFPAGAEQPVTITRSDLLSPSAGPSPGKKIAGYACKEILFMSAMSAATGFVGDVVAEGRGEAVKFVVRVIGEKVAAGACDALVEKSPTPELDPRNSMAGNLDMARITISPDQAIAAPKPLALPPCSPGQFYNMNALLCVDLEVSPNCPPGQVYLSGQCTDIASLAGPRCAAYEEFDTLANKCVMPKCARPLFFNPLENKCVLEMTFGGAGCRADQLPSNGTCVSMPLR
jgi:hypothetical protein